MKSPIGLLATLLLATTLRAQETWTPRTSGVTVPLWSVAQSAGQWVAVGEQGTILTSPDGAAWTPRTSGFPTRWLVGVGYGTPGGSGLWVVVGESGLILTSPDANTWTARRTAGTRINAVAWGNGTFVAGDDNGSTYFSLDGLAWSGPFASARSGFIRGLVYGAPHFVTTGLNNIQTTYDGQQSTGRGASTPQLQGTAYGRRLYFATGGANTYTSRDAITWTQQSGTTNVGVQGATFFNNQFVAVGNTGGIATTFDGSAWANRVSGTTQTLLAVAASAGSIVAVGSGGTILQSSAAPAAPTIAAQPAAVTEVPGGNVAFTVTARGSAPLTYQWRRDGVDLVGATADTLFLPAITSGQSGLYNCSVTNSAGTVVSAPAALNIVAGFPLPDPMDLSFTLGPSLNAAPRTAAVQPDGKIIIGGDFLFLNEGQAQFGLARLTANGALDPTFRPGAVTGGPIETIVLQPDGRILIGGTFTSISGVNRNRLARLNSDGSLDPSFVPAYSGVRPLSLVLTPAGQVIVCDAFQIVRLNSDGTLDPNWIFIRGSLGISAIEEYPALALQADGKVILGEVTGSRTRRVSIRRLNPNGSNDLGFGSRGVGEGRTGILGQLGALKVLPDGRIMAAAIRGGLATIRLTADGNTDPTFTPFIDPTLSVSAVSFTSDGRTWFGGSFSSIAGTTRNQIARLNADGSLDATFNPGAGVFAANNATVAPAAILALDDGRALLLGNFARINTTARAQVARLNAQSLGDSNRPVVLSLDNYYREIRAGEGLTVQVNATGSPALTYGGNAFGSNLTGFATAAVVVPQPITQTSGPYTFFATNTAVTARRRSSTSESSHLLLSFLPNPWPFRSTRGVRPRLRSRLAEAPASPTSGSKTAPPSSALRPLLSPTPTPRPPIPVTIPSSSATASASPPAKPCASASTKPRAS